MEINEFKHAEESILKMENSIDLETYEKNWKDFLTYRAFNKIKALSKTDSKYQKYLNYIGHAKKNDPLLIYISQARHSNEHTVREIVKKEHESTSISGGVGGGSIHRGTISGDGKINSLETTGNIIIKFSSSKLIVIPVIDRGGKIYAIPANHQEKILNTKIPHELAKISLDYYLNAWCLK